MTVDPLSSLDWVRFPFRHFCGAVLRIMTEMKIQPCQAHPRRQRWESLVRYNRDEVFGRRYRPADPTMSRLCLCKWRRRPRSPQKCQEIRAPLERADASSLAHSPDARAIVYDSRSARNVMAIVDRGARHFGEEVGAASVWRGCCGCRSSSCYLTRLFVDVITYE